MVLGRSDYQWIHEPILYGWKPGAAHRWYGGRKLTTIIEHGEGGAVRRLDDGRWAVQAGDDLLIVDANATLEEHLGSVIYHDKPARNGQHPTMKPVSLIERNLRASSRAGDIVIDGFGGSGSTLMAADRLGQAARLMELDCGYVDVIVRRWQEYSGGGHVWTGMGLLSTKSWRRVPPRRREAALMATLSDLQTERAKLRALDAKSTYKSALADTTSHKDVVAAAAAMRSALDAAMRGMPRVLAMAIDGEADETRVHYLLSDAIHTALTGIGADVEHACTVLPPVGEQFKRGAQPRDLLTVSQWADRHRWLRSGTNAPGRWNTALTPYLREIMDALSEHSPVRTVVFQKSSGVGGSEVMMNWTGYVMHHLQNKDMLVVMPTLELRDRSFNPRMAKMVEETEALAGLISRNARDKTNRADVVEYGAHARIIRSGANSPDSLRSDHLPYVICDEVSAFPWDVGGEGDPMTLIENRQRTYSRAKSYFISTPTIAGRCRISLQYSRSDQRRYHVPCPSCGTLQHLEFDRSGVADHGLKWRTAPPVDAETGEVLRPRVLSAWYVCKNCHAEIPESSKTDMLAHGKWIAARPSVKRTRGYHINALYAPVGLGVSWRDVAQKWLDCQGDTSEMKAFVNTYLGEAWAEQGDSIEDLSLISRLEDYDPTTLLFRLITAGVDVQKNRLEVSYVGWGEKRGGLADRSCDPAGRYGPAGSVDGPG